MPAAHRSSWWREAVAYPVGVRSSADAIGHLTGLFARLDPVADVDGPWLNRTAYSLAP
ncbi:MAG: hypothetical protein ABIO48_12160 [Pedococcus sp.]